jgi:hypothetical protein
MKKGMRVLLGAGFVALLLISWAVAASAKSPAQKQAELIERATALIADEIYVSAMPLLEEAVGYGAMHTPEAEARLKEVYLKLMGQSGIRNKYLGLLDTQMNRADVAPSIFAEAASFHLSINRLPDALDALKKGIEKLNDQSLIDFYEAERYVFKSNRDTYPEVTEISNGRIQVCENGLWGLANADGSLAIPCEYDKISNYSNSRAIVMKDGIVYAVDSGNNRIALSHESIADIGNYGNDRVGVKTGKGWQRANGEFAIGSASFDDIGMYSSNYAAAKQDGKWGVIGTGSEWLLPAEFDEIICDELGRCYGQGAVFAKIGGKAFLFVDSEQLPDAYDDARPFTADGWAAAKRNGKWGFIDTSGVFVIQPQFDDALSFSGHLAAVRQGELWGYVALTGKIAIEPQFLLAKSFQNGNAPVLTDRGYQFIALVEYQKGAEL